MVKPEMEFIVQKGERPEDYLKFTAQTSGHPENYFFRIENTELFAEYTFRACHEDGNAYGEEGNLHGYKKGHHNIENPQILVTIRRQGKVIGDIIRSKRQKEVVADLFTRLDVFMKPILEEVHWFYDGDSKTLWGDNFLKPNGYYPEGDVYRKKEG